MSANIVRGLTPIIIPCWNQLEFTRKCIAALFRQTGAELGTDCRRQRLDRRDRGLPGGVQDRLAVPVDRHCQRDKSRFSGGDQPGA